MEQLTQQLNIALERISKLESSIKIIESEKKQLDDKLKQVISTVERHQHTDSDGTVKLRRGVEVISDSGNISYIGNGGVIQISSIDSNNDKTHAMVIAVGEDKGVSPSDKTSSTNSQLVITQYNNGTGTFFYSSSNPQYANYGKSVSSGGSTLSDSSFPWTTDELAGCYINIYNSSGSFQFTRQISTNTSDEITISGTWPSSVSSCSYLIFTPTYLGSADNPWRRVYTGEGTGEGIRFGYGPTNGGQNGLLYMDSSGELYWRDKGGSSTLISSGVSGASGSFTTVDGKTVTVSGGLVTSIV